jgi:hypothetical protein
MGGAIGSQFGGSGILSLVWIALWLLFGPVIFIRLLVSSQRFRERSRNMCIAGAVTVAPVFFIMLGRLLDSL